MDIPVRRGNIFTLLEDEEPEEVQVPKPKQPKTQTAPAAQSKPEPKSTKPKAPAKKPQNQPEPPTEEPQKTQGKEPQKVKFADKPERDDRKSKTGRGREVKKGGAGRNNWGKPEDDVKAEPEVPWTDTDKKEPETQPAEDKPAEEVPKEDPKPDFITFSDYLKPKETKDEDEKEDDEGHKGLLSFKVSFGARSERRGRGRGRRGGRDEAGETREDDKTRPKGQHGGPRNNPRNKDSAVRTEAAPNPSDFAAFPSLA